MDDMLRRQNRPRIQLDDEYQPQAQEAVLDTEPLQPTLGHLAVASENYDVQDYDDNVDQAPEEEKKPKKPKKKRRGFRVPTPKTKKQWIIAIVVMVLALGGAGFAVYWFIIRSTEPPVVHVEPVIVTPEEPEPIYSVLSGREIASEDINKRPIFAVQIENSPEARPQSGLKDASIVTEMVAEGGITRFNAIYQDVIPSNLGPVRSLRPYYIDMFLPYDAVVVHAGGSGEAIKDINRLGKSFNSVSSIMRRISERYSPHNYYTRGKQVLDLAVDRGYKPKVDNPLPRKDAEPAETPTAKTINVTISSYNYNVKYVWDAKTNTYKREQGGAKHVDAESKKQLAPDVVVVPIMGKRPHRDGVHTQYSTTGSGKVYVFQDGKVTVGTWSKPKRSSQWVLKDGKGKVISLNRGQTWFTVTDAAGNVKYSK